MSADYFDWTTIEDDVVVPEQAQIAVYNNPNGGIVCRQAGQYGPDEDSWIFFHPSHALAIVKAILDKAGLSDLLVVHKAVFDVMDRRAGRAADVGANQDEEPAATKRTAKTAAERQRRRREKQRQRDSHGAERDIHRDTVTTAPLIPEFDLQNGGPKALAN
jgi:hypothetical protein